MAAMDVYFMTIYDAIGLQCKMAAMYASLPNERLEMQTVVARISFNPADVPSGCKCITLFVTQHLLIMRAMKA
jgi:hypothetical protein